MIAYLKGKIVAKTANALILVRGDIGYEVMVPVQVWRAAKQGAAVALFTHEYIREDARELFGFNSLPELIFFRKLITISGVGPRVAMHVMSLGALAEITSAIAAGNIAFLTAVPGIGAKIAQKIVLEMKGRLDAASGMSPEENESIEALQGLGYSASQAQGALRRVPPEVTDVGDRVREALKLLGQKVI